MALCHGGRLLRRSPIFLCSSKVLILPFRIDSQVTDGIPEGFQCQGDSCGECGAYRHTALAPPARGMQCGLKGTGANADGKCAATCTLEPIETVRLAALWRRYRDWGGHATGLSAWVAGRVRKPAPMECGSPPIRTETHTPAL